MCWAVGGLWGMGVSVPMVFTLGMFSQSWQRCKTKGSPHPDAFMELNVTTKTKYGSRSSPTSLRWYHSSSWCLIVCYMIQFSIRWARIHTKEGPGPWELIAREVFRNLRPKHQHTGASSISRPPYLSWKRKRTYYFNLFKNFSCYFPWASLFFRVLRS